MHLVTGKQFADILNIYLSRKKPLNTKGIIRDIVKNIPCVFFRII